MENVEWVVDRYRFTEGRDYRVLVCRATFTNETEARFYLSHLVLLDKTDDLFLTKRTITETTEYERMGRDVPAGGMS